MLRFVLICCGGAIGTGLRYLLASWIGNVSGSAFPFGTLSVNLIGSFAIGLVMAMATRNEAISETTRLVIVTGVLGGFTTYSAFNYESLELVREGAARLGMLNVIATMTGCWLSGTIGMWIGFAFARGTN